MEDSLEVRSELRWESRQCVIRAQIAADHRQWRKRFALVLVLLGATVAVAGALAR